MRPQKPRRVCFWALCRKATGLRSLLPGQVAATHGLESHDDISDLQVPFLLQVCQDPGPEEDFALPDSVQVGVEFQGFDLQKKGGTGALVLSCDMCPWGVFQEGPTPTSSWQCPQRRGWRGGGGGCICSQIPGEGLELGLGLTMRMQACFPSMKPLGMALAARIS